MNAAQAYNNSWYYVEVLDYEDGTAIDGDTGVVTILKRAHK